MMREGDYIKTQHDTGCFGVEPFYSRIAKINRVNVRVRTENGDTATVTKEFALKHLIALDAWHPEISLERGSRICRAAPSGGG